MRKIGLLVALLSVCLISAVQADSVNYVDNDVDFLSPILVEVDHIEGTGLQDEDFKGYFNLTATNTGTEAWGDFHFFICNFGTTPNVIFVNDAGQTTTSIAGAVINVTDYQVDFTFYGNPVGVGQSVSFSVYTDNTTSQYSQFCVGFCPTPVPEPATLSMLGLGALSLLRRKK